MATVLASGKRLLIMLYSIIALGQVSVKTPVTLWAASWWTNRASIVLLTGVNTAITAVSEATSRGLLAAGSGQADQQFFIQDASGKTQIHRQSIVNIFMTLIASLLGGPVYFIRGRWNRFMFFISFGAMNSVVAQMFAHMIRDGVIALTLGRFVFDFCYNGTLKFWMFEFARPAILKLRKSFLGVGVVRVTQDFLTTLFRVGLLNWFGFK